MRNTIAHKLHFLPRNIGVGGGECRVVARDVARRLADDFQITNHSILYQFVAQKCRISHTLRVALNLSIWST
ncbi:hypothetical protein R69776_00956 [Paraburkholderia nemoris]|uniref:Uncharacterized protein n=1 Tax=Paraburkholderia nemoris TaxID=2793076 RepID=A0ABN7KRA7_9BURK|nr:hypothetical protein R69776_00956 [Paraburkholderia nemoris]